LALSHRDVVEAMATLHGLRLGLGSVSAIQDQVSKALEAVRQVSGVTGAVFTSQLPLSGDDDEYGAHFEGDDPKVGYNVFRYAVSPGYFETLGIPLRRGRLLDAHDAADAPLAAVISESLAQREFPNQDPIGQHVHIGPIDRLWFTVVSVGGDVKQASLAASQTDAVYTTPRQWFFADNTMSLVVRARANVAALTPAIRNALWSVNKTHGNQKHKNGPFDRVHKALGLSFFRSLLFEFEGDIFPCPPYMKPLIHA
jgi:putative ABC transport system permease protein